MVTLGRTGSHIPLYDYKCDDCAEIEFDVWHAIPKDTDPLRFCKACGATMHRAMLSRTSNVIGDECDVWIKNGICNEDGSPRHYTSKAEMKRVADSKGLVNVVRHVPRPGTDKSPHTQKWY